MEHTLFVIGIGPGHPDYMAPRGKQIIAQCNVVVGSSRALQDYATAGQLTHAITGKLDEMLLFITKHIENQDVAVLVSGDTGYYSLLPYLKRTLPSMHMEVIAGISSVTFAFARLQEPWQEADLISFHGRVPNINRLYYEQGRSLGCLTDNHYTPAAIAELLMQCGWPPETRAAACERLSYEDEHIVRTTLHEMITLEGFKHAVMVVLG